MCVHPTQSTSCCRPCLHQPRDTRYSSTALTYDYAACSRAGNAFLAASNLQSQLSAAQSLVMGATFFVIFASTIIVCVRLLAISRRPQAALNSSLMAQLTEDSGVRDIISKASMHSIKNTLNFRYLFVLVWTIIVILLRAIFETLFGLSGLAPQDDECDLCGTCQPPLFLLFTVLVNEPVIQARCVMRLGVV
jgi:hypothetical protein